MTRRYRLQDDRHTGVSAAPPGYRYTRETCPDRAKHTERPEGYVAFMEWAEKKGTTHTQERCPTCLLWCIWKPKRKAAARA